MNVIKIFSHGTRNLFCAFAAVLMLAFIACDTGGSDPDPITYTVTFDINEGSGTAPSSQTVNSGSRITLPGGDGLTKSGFTLVGWNTKADNTGTNYKAGSPYTVAKNITLYARWWDDDDDTLESVEGLAEKIAWVEFFAESNSSHTIELGKDEDIAPQTISCSGRTDVTIILKGTGTERTISLSSDGSLFSLESGVTLVLDEKITLQGRSSNTDTLIGVNTGSVLEMKAGAKITGNTNTGTSFGPFGGGLVVAGGTFTMKGGEISNNTADNGGGVLVHQGTFTMEGGEISGNTATSDEWAAGGGVQVNQGAIFIMTGGEISGNTADNGGGGVNVYQGTFTMEDGEISGNTTSNGNGGGVFVSQGTFTMSGTAKISNNTATSDEWASGGGVYVSQGATFTMTGGEISGNTADNGGGGVNVYRGTFTMSETAKISGNYAKSSSGWTAGGGVYLDSGTFTMQGGEISGNTATSDASEYWSEGGGVWVNSGTFTMQGGEISGNAAKGGGGVCVNDGATFRIVNGTIYGSDEGGNSNTADDGSALNNHNNSGIAQRGTFNGATWTKKGDLTTTSDTIEVTNGESQ